mgnify:CR=1 FL=1
MSTHTDATDDEGDEGDDGFDDFGVIISHNFR